jgi:murein DD-endopeptidase MepM/ murein hydrolase activator NlpD
MTTTAAVLLAVGLAAGTVVITDGPAPARPAPEPVVVTATGGGAPVSVPDAGRLLDDARVPPVDADPVRRFEPPPHEYGPGHRGVDLPASAGGTVVSPADGTVTFAGPVAGRGVLVVEHAAGTLTSLEPVEAGVPVGTVVGAGEPVARVQPAPAHAGCTSTCVHWGVRIEGRYVDPWWWLGRSAPVRLLPLSDP